MPRCVCHGLHKAQRRRRVHHALLQWQGPQLSAVHEGLPHRPQLQEARVRGGPAQRQVPGAVIQPQPQPQPQPVTWAGASKSRSPSPSASTSTSPSTSTSTSPSPTAAPVFPICKQTFENPSISDTTGKQPIGAKSAGLQWGSCQWDVYYVGSLPSSNAPAGSVTVLKSGDQVGFPSTISPTVGAPGGKQFRPLLVFATSGLNGVSTFVNVQGYLNDVQIGPLLSVNGVVDYAPTPLALSVIGVVDELRFSLGSDAFFEDF
jgi:hypothetical protein